MTDGDTILTRDEHSGRIHKRIRNGRRLMVDERCNTDDAGAYLVIPESALAEVDADSLCRFCFAPTVVTIDEPAVTGA
jgi:hypothetical protein